MTETKALWRARCEAMRAVTCYLAGADFTALDIDREPVPETPGDAPQVNAEGLRENWEAVEALAGILADKRRMPADEARAIIADACRFFSQMEGDEA